jgi:hypothetical protein
MVTGQRAVAAGIAALLLLGACASGHRAPYPPGLTPVRDLAAVERRLAAAAAATPGARLEEIGRVVASGFSAPIWRWSFRTGQPHAPRVLVNAAIHGNEPAGSECALALIEDIAAGRPGTTGLDFDILPVVNPWGYAHDTRHNAGGIDINRDLAGFRSAEARILRDFVRGRSFDLALDLHEDPSATGFYVYQYGLAEKKMSASVVAAVRQAGFPIEENVRMVILRTEGGIIDAPLWGLYYMRLTGQLSLANYYRLNASGAVFTVETPTRLPFADRLRIQRLAADLYLSGSR